MTTLATLPWTNRAAAQAVLKAFEAAREPVRFVGGCVRDAQAGIANEHTDIDMATPAIPDRVIQILESAGIKAVPTGVQYGTVTAVYEKDKVEITTLRRDLKTDGRHADVAFGLSWEDDAARRDFTINALYADADGTLHDYHNGIEDLQAQQVRFIGDAGARIAEDYLRILRFYRFSARFGATTDEAGARACAAAIGKLDRLSRERVWMELGKIISLSEPLRAIEPMIKDGVLAALLGGNADAARLARLADYEHDNHVTPVPVLRLAAVLADYQGLQDKLALSNREAAWLDVAAASLRADNMPALQEAWYHTADKINPVEWLPSLALLLLADDDVKQKHKWPTDLFALASLWQAPVFPLSGSDVMALGVPAGPRIGSLLGQVESWWIAQSFKPRRDDCLEHLRTLAG